MKPRPLIVGVLISLLLGLASCQTSVPAPNGATLGANEPVPATPAKKQEMNHMQEAMSQACDKDPEACAKRRAAFERRVQENANEAAKDK